MQIQRAHSSNRRDRVVVSRRAIAAAAAALSFFSAAGCHTLSRSAAAVSFATDPPGARVVVDRKDSGFVTPCRIALPEKNHRVDLSMPGYATETLRVEKTRRTEVILWRDMFVRHEVWRFPIWLNLEDAFEPVKVIPTCSPGHVFVRLERAAQQ